MNKIASRRKWQQAHRDVSRAYALGEFSGAPAWHRREVALLEDLVELAAAIAERLDVEVPVTVVEPDPEPVIHRSRWARLWRR